MSISVWSIAGQAALEKFVTPDTLFAFDLDGTLAPIIADRSAVDLSPDVQSALQELMAVAKVAVITGRSRKDAREILGFEPDLLVGNHGAEWPGRESSRNWRFVKQCLGWRGQLYLAIHDLPGVDIEFKGESIAIHYRHADNSDHAAGLIAAAVGSLEPLPRIIGGKSVVNLLPSEAWTKGQALVDAMATCEAKSAIYFGDDETDEEVFRMGRNDIFGIHIGKDDRTTAPYYLDCQAQILDMLVHLTGIFEPGGKQLTGSA